MGREWGQATHEVLESLSVSLENGLSTKKVEELRKEFGSNELDKEEGTPLWKVRAARRPAAIAAARAARIMPRAFGRRTPCGAARYARRPLRRTLLHPSPPCGLVGLLSLAAGASAV
jgi:magnesium-transporting ATPase (P-type)